MSERRERVPGWIKAVTTLLLGLWVLMNVAYRLGADGFSVHGSDLDLQRQFDSSLFEVDDSRSIAFVLSERGDVSLVRYQPGLIPFRPVCGMNEMAGNVIPGEAFKKGRFIYTMFPEMEGPDVYDLETGELHTLDPPEPKKGFIDPATVPFYAEHGLDFEDEHRIEPIWVADNYDNLSHINESCMAINGAFFLLFALMFVFTLIALVVSLFRRQPA